MEHDVHIRQVIHFRFERETDVPGQNTKKLNTGLLMRLWYPPTLLVCSYIYRSPDRSEFQSDLAKRQSW